MHQLVLLTALTVTSGLFHHNAKPCKTETPCVTAAPVAPCPPPVVVESCHTPKVKKHHKKHGCGKVACTPSCAPPTVTPTCAPAAPVYTPAPVASPQVAMAYTSYYAAPCATGNCPR